MLCLFHSSTFSEPVVMLPMDMIDANLIGSIHGSTVQGTLINGPTITPGQHGGALETDGLDQRVDFGEYRSECFYRPDMCTEGVTYAVWLRRMRLGFLEVFLCTGGFYSSSIGYALYQSPDGEVRILVFDQTHYYRATSVVDWPINHWEHIVWTWKENEGITFYVNGCRLSGPETVKYTVKDRTDTISRYGSFTLGAGSQGTAYSHMKMDDLTIWHSVLTDNQVWQLYVNGGRRWMHF